MAGSDDRGLDLRLPWGRTAAPGPERRDRAAEPPDGAADTGPERSDRAPSAPPERPKRRRQARTEQPAPAREERREGPDPARRSRRAERGPEAGTSQPVGDPPAPAPAAAAVGLEVEPAGSGGTAGPAGSGGMAQKAGPDTVPPEVDDALILAATPGLADRLERLELAILPWFTRLEEQATAHEAEIESRLEKLETRLVGAHDASVEAVGLLAGHLVARLEEQVAGIEEAIEAKHQRLVSHVEASLAERHTEILIRLEADRSAILEALDGVASGQLVERLLEGVVALGEVLDADLVNLRRLISEEHLGPISPREAMAAVDRSAMLDSLQPESDSDGSDDSEELDDPDELDDGDDPPP